jgi:hypothetical protein
MKQTGGMYTFIQGVRGTRGYRMKWLNELNWNWKTVYARFGSKYVPRKIGRIQIYNPDRKGYNPNHAGCFHATDGRVFKLVEISPAYHLDPEMKDRMEGFRG